MSEVLLVVIGITFLIISFTGIGNDDDDGSHDWNNDNDINLGI